MKKSIRSTEQLTKGNLPPYHPPANIQAQLWESLLKSGYKRNLKNREILYKRGELLHSVAVIISGVLILKNEATILDFLESGDALAGVLSLSQSKFIKYPINSLALGDCEILELPFEKVQQLMKVEDIVSNYFFTQYSKRMDFIQSCRIMQSFPVQSRIAHFFLSKKLLLETGLITRKMIAQVANTTTESAIRVLSSWQKEGVISIHEKKIKINKMNDLISIVQNVRPISAK